MLSPRFHFPTAPFFCNKERKSTNEKRGRKGKKKLLNERTKTLRCQSRTIKTIFKLIKLLNTLTLNEKIGERQVVFRLIWTYVFFVRKQVNRKDDNIFTSG